MIKKIRRKSAKWCEKQREKLEGLDEYEDFVEIDKINWGIDEFPENLQEFCFNVFVNDVLGNTDQSNDTVVFDTKEHKDGKDDVAQIYFTYGQNGGEPQMIVEIIGNNECVKQLTYHHCTYKNDVVLHNLDFDTAKWFINYVFTCGEDFSDMIKLVYSAGFENGKNDTNKTTKKK